VTSPRKRIQQWARALADRLHAAEVVAETEIDIELRGQRACAERALRTGRLRSVGRTSPMNGSATGRLALSPRISFGLHWGAVRARATGVASVTTCDPDCASGGREDYPVELVAERLPAFDYGKPQYTRVT
jgi:hypothetical protein